MAEPRRQTRSGSRKGLDTPTEVRRPLLRRPTYDADAFGSFAEQFARFMGTARFLLYMTLFVVVWIAWNALAPADLAWDPYAFIFLTLMLSLQASYAAPLILLAQNRQEARDRVALESDREQTAQSRADMDFLAREIAGLRMSVGELATRDFLRGQLRAEIRAIIDELEAEDEGGEDGGGLDQPSGERRGSANGVHREAGTEARRRDEGVRSR